MYPHTNREEEEGVKGQLARNECSDRATIVNFEQVLYPQFCLIILFQQTVWNY